jgi:glutathione S-transferase
VARYWFINKLKYLSLASSLRLTAAPSMAKAWLVRNDLGGRWFKAFRLGRGVAMFYYTALITLASVFFYFWLGLSVGKARARFKIAAPATTGDPAFERIYRVQMNTLEWMVVYLPCLWLFAFFVSDAGAGVIGMVWIAGRYLYKRGYEEAPEKRSLGFTVQFIAVTALFLGVLINILARLALGD